MFWPLKTRAKPRRKASDIYGAIVTQARRPAFYASLGVPDTPAGRYEMVVLHLFLVLERLHTEAASVATLPQALVDAFVADIDDALRELGTGDTAVGKQVKHAAAGFYERSRDYRTALAGPGPGALGKALAAHVLRQDQTDGRSGALAAYVRRAVACLAEQDGAKMSAGAIAFPPVTPPAQELR